MLRIFQKIRSSLLDQRRLQQYLLYAIGEILLVVIGILIALQINNWNTSRIESTQLDGYLNNIAKNIQSDLVAVQAIRQFRNSTVAYSEKSLEILNNKVVPGEVITEEDFMAYFSDEISVFHDQYFHASQSGFDALKSSGYLGKIQGTELESNLYEYYGLVDEIAQQERSLHEFIEDLQVLYYSKNIPQRVIRISQQPHVGEYIGQHQTEIRQLMSEPTFTGANVRNAISPRILLPYYDKLIDLGEKITGNIDTRSQ